VQELNRTACKEVCKLLPRHSEGKRYPDSRHYETHNKIAVALHFRFDLPVEQVNPERPAFCGVYTLHLRRKVYFCTAGYGFFHGLNNHRYLRLVKQGTLPVLRPFFFQGKGEKYRLFALYKPIGKRGGQ